MGSIFSALFKRRRHIIEVNIALCFPELSADEQKKLVDENIKSTTLGIIETAFGWWASDKAILSRSRTEGFELLEQAKKEGRGVLLLGAHLTTLDLSGRVIGLNADIDITYKEQDNPLFNYWMDKARKRSFGNIIEKNAMRSMVKSLRSGRVVWYAPDQDFGRQGSVFVPFFHRPAATLTTAGKLLKMTGVKPLFYAHFRKKENGRIVYVARICDLYHDDFNDDDIHNTTLINKALAEILREHPEQYLWAHERFRTQPNPGDPKPYTKYKKKKKKPE